jgi:tetratricopeptide (TPR) repeat protein
VGIARGRGRGRRRRRRLLSAAAIAIVACAASIVIASGRTTGPAFAAPTSSEPAATTTTTSPFAAAERLAKAGYLTEAKAEVAKQSAAHPEAPIPADLRAARLSTSAWWDDVLSLLVDLLHIVIIVFLALVVINLAMRVLGRRFSARVGWWLSRRRYANPFTIPLVWLWRPELKVIDSVGDVGAEFSASVRHRMREIASDSDDPNILLATASDETFSIPDLTALDAKVGAFSSIVTTALRRDVLTLATWLDASATTLTCVAELTGSGVSQSVTLRETLHAKDAKDAVDPHALLAARLAGWTALTLQDVRPSFAGRRSVRASAAVAAFGTLKWESFAAFLAGFEAQRAGNQNEAETRYIKALAADSRNAKALLNLARLRSAKADEVDERRAAIEALYTLATGLDPLDGPRCDRFPIPVRGLVHSQLTRSDRFRALFTFAIAVANESRSVPDNPGHEASERTLTQEALSWTRYIVDLILTAKQWTQSENFDAQLDAMLVPAVSLYEGLLGSADRLGLPRRLGTRHDLPSRQPGLDPNQARGLLRAALRDQVDTPGSLAQPGVVNLAEWLGNWLRVGTLVKGPMAFDPITLYNFACNFAITGATDDAFMYLDWALRADPRLRKSALDDPALEPLRNDRRWTPLVDPLPPNDVALASPAPATNARDAWTSPRRT